MSIILFPSLHTAEPKTDVIPLDEVADHEPEMHGLRLKRATCDLLSFSPFSGTACAVSCISLRRGFHGGYCSKGVCRCRK